MSLRVLKQLFRAIEREAAQNPPFLAELDSALNDDARSKRSAPPAEGQDRPRNKRPPAVLDPLHLIASVGEDGLRQRLQGLTAEQLKDIISEFGMDTARLALKWESRERLLEHVVSTATARSKKGNAFRA
jgi:hypothetical protein